ncbi:hypothetical protein [Kitasatospora purpeofusca]|uniref:hypothetical protein n=1 Tax=Kitasatospora purpeofusca TaxID=67352 RepID=UPI0035D53D5D
MTLTFSVSPGTALEGKLNYLTSEHSFLYDVTNRADLAERVGSNGVSSLVVETLQLEIGIASGEALFVWGYYPMASWVPAELDLPKFSAGRVLVDSDGQLEEGVSISLSDATWQTRYDSTTGWINVRAEEDSGAHFTQIADGVVLGINDSRMISIWLKPKFSV